MGAAAAESGDGDVDSACPERTITKHARADAEAVRQAPILGFIASPSLPHLLRAKPARKSASLEDDAARFQAGWEKFVLGLRFP
jgi:hypothetical protein